MNTHHPILGKRRTGALWLWISVRMIALAFLALALVGGGMWYRYAMWDKHLHEAMPESVRQELQRLEAWPDENQARLRQIYGEYLYGDYFSPTVIQEDMLFFVALVALALPLIVTGGVWVSLRLSRQLSAVALSAGAIARGDFSSRVSLMPHTPSGLQTLTADFNDMAERLQRYDRELQESGAAIAHELRTPLTAAIGRLQGMLDGVFQADHRQLKTVMRQLHHLSRLTDDMNLLSMAQAGKLVLHRGEFSIKKLCEERVSWASPSLDAAGIQVVIRIPEYITLLADRDRIGQLLSVLIDNALRYAASGKKLVFRAHVSQEQMILLVKDRGPGFTAGHLDRACERFWRAESSRSQHAGGSGLGLSIARAICVAHGGTLTVHNLNEGGACICARLPLRPEPD